MNKLKAVICALIFLPLCLVFDLLTFVGVACTWFGEVLLIPSDGDFCIVRMWEELRKMTRKAEV